MAPEEQEINIRDTILEYGLIVWKRRWLVLSVAVVVVITTIVVLAAQKPMFSATAEMVIESSQSSALGKDFALDKEIPDKVADTQVQLMKMSDFHQKVADELNRLMADKKANGNKEDDDPYATETFHGLLSTVRAVTFFLKSPADEAEAPDENAQPSAEGTPVAPKPKYSAKNVEKSLTVNKIRNTYVIQITSLWPNAQEAALVANTVAELFIKERINRRLTSLQQSLNWLQSQLRQEQADMDKSRIDLYNFMDAYGITGIEANRGTKLDEELKILDERLNVAKETTGALKLKYAQILTLSKSEDLIDTIPEAMGNELISELRKQEIQLDQEVIKLSATFGANHPKIMTVERQLATTRNSKQQEIQKLVNSIKSQYETALFQENTIIQAKNKLQAELDDLKKKTIKYYALKREVESNEKFYDVVLTRLKETALTEEISKSSSVSIVQRASPPEKPSSPRVPRTLALGFIVALGLGVGLAFFLDMLDNTFTRPVQIEQHLGLTFLGAVPFFEAGSNSGQGEHPAVIALNNPKSAASEAYRALRTSILLCSADVQPQILLVTSPGKSEGKSSTAANLAIVMAQAGNRVLAIDCDLRRPRLHKYFSLARKNGMAELLVNRDMDPDAVILHTSVPNLDIISSGVVPPNPSELLGSKRMMSVLTALREKYDRIILDSPPMLAATDSTVLASTVDAAVLVVRAGETTRNAGQRALGLLRDVNTPVLGVLLNGITIDRDGYYYYYDYYHYGNYYGGDDTDKTGAKSPKRKWWRKDDASSLAAGGMDQPKQ